MPYTVAKNGPEDKPFCVYKADKDGKPTGDPLGCHESADEAGAQIGAIEREEEATKAGRVLSEQNRKLIANAIQQSREAIQALQDLLDNTAFNEQQRRAVADALRSVRALAQTDDTLTVGGYGVLWHGQDLYKTWFTPKTDFWDGKITRTPVVLYDHGMREAPGREVIGRTTAQRDDDLGRWVEAELDLHNRYVAAIQELLDKRALGWSSGAVSHLIEVAPTGEIKSWPIVEYSLTPTPAEPRTLGVQELKVLADSVPEVKALVPKDDSEAVTAASEASGPERLAEGTVSFAPGVAQKQQDGATNQTEVDEMVDMLTAANVEEIVAKTFAAHMDKLVEKLAAAAPPAKKGEAVTLENAPKDGSGEKSLGNFLFCVHTGNEKRLREVYGATRAALAEGAGETGGYLVPTEFVPKLLEVAAEQAIVRPRAFVQRMAERQVEIPMLKQTAQPTAGTTNFFGGVNFVWTEEAGTKTETEPGFKMMKLVAHELSGYTLASNALLAHSAIGLEQLLKRLFGGAIAWIEDYTFLNGNGVGKPLGILNSPALIGVTRGTDGHFTAPDVTGMLSRLLPTSYGKAVWLIHPSVMPDVADLKNSANYPLWLMNMQGPLGTTLMGLPIIWTEKVGTLGSDYSVVLADLSYYVIGDSIGLEIASSVHYKFINNQTTWRVSEWIDGQPWLDGPIYLQNATTTVSPFVALEDHT